MRRQNIQSFAFFLLANTLLILFLGRNGPQVQIDTANYYSAAYNLLHGNGLLLFDGEYLQNAPPFFSVLALPCYIFEIPENAYLWLVHLLAFNTTLLITHKLLLFFNVSNPKLASLFVLTFGFSWLHIWTFALSETVFLPLYLAWMYSLLKRGKYTLIYSAILFALLCLTRYMAWMLLPGILFPILFIKNFWRKAIFSVIPGAFISLAWFWFNFQLNKKTLGDHNLIDKFSIMAVCDNLLNWYNGFVNGAFFLNAAMLIYLILIIVSTSLFFYLIAKFENSIRAGVSLILGTGISIIFLLLCQSGLSLIQLPRYISILWTPLAISICLFVDFVKLKEGSKIVMLITSISVHLLFFQIQGVEQRERTKLDYLSHSAFNHYYQNSTCKLGNYSLSNFPDLVWWVSKKQCMYTPFLNENKNSFLARLGSNHNQKVIWFDNLSRFKVMRTDLDWVLNKKPCFEGQGFSIMTLDSFSY